MTSHKHMIFSVSSYHINILYQFKVSSKRRCNSTSSYPNRFKLKAATYVKAYGKPEKKHDILHSQLQQSLYFTPSPHILFTENIL